MTKQEVENRLEKYLRLGAADLLLAAQAYCTFLSSDSGHAERRRAKRIHEAVRILHEQAGVLYDDYKAFYEHILTPEAHRSIALLRREREHLKGSAVPGAQDLYREINQLLPVFYHLHDEERRRRRIFIKDLPMRKDS